MRVLKLVCFEAVCFEDARWKMCYARMRIDLKKIGG
jgi:hypothetical protein